MTDVVTGRSWYGVDTVVSRCYHFDGSILAKTFLHSKTFDYLLSVSGFVLSFLILQISSIFHAMALSNVD